MKVTYLLAMSMFLSLLMAPLKAETTLDMQGTIDNGGFYSDSPDEYYDEPYSDGPVYGYGDFYSDDDAYDFPSDTLDLGGDFDVGGGIGIDVDGSYVFHHGSDHHGRFNHHDRFNHHGHFANHGFHGHSGHFGQGFHQHSGHFGHGFHGGGFHGGGFHGGGHGGGHR